MPDDLRPQPPATPKRTPEEQLRDELERELRRRHDEEVLVGGLRADLFRGPFPLELPELPAGSRYVRPVLRLVEGGAGASARVDLRAVPVTIAASELDLAPETRTMLARRAVARLLRALARRLDP